MIKLLLGIGSMAASYAAHLWVLSCAWAWFAVPLGAPRVSLWFLAGLSVVWSYLTYRKDWKAEEKAEDARRRGEAGTLFLVTALTRALGGAGTVGIMWLIRWMAGA